MSTGAPPPDPSWRRYARFVRPDVRADVDDEIAFHLDARTDQLAATGLSPAHARRQALEEFGSMTRYRAAIVAHAERRVRRGARIAWFDGIAADLTASLRALRRAPGLAAAVVATLALGIGLTAAIFAVVNAYLFRPLPVRDADRLVALGTSSPALRQPHEMSLPEIADYRALTDVFAGIAASTNTTVNLSSGEGRAERALVEEATADYFAVVGVDAALGRTFLPHEDASPHAHQVAVLSHGFWRRRFAGDSSAIGRTVRFNGRPFTIVGVLPARFPGVQSLLDTDAWVPLHQLEDRTALRTMREANFLTAIGRLQPGVTLTAARARVDLRARQLEAEYPATNREVRTIVAWERHARPLIFLSAYMPKVGALFMLLAGLVLVIACANVASLLLARATARERELAVRAALGAGRGRLVRLALVESLLLSAAGGVAALGVAWWATGVIRGVRLATDTPIRFPVEPDWRVFVFTLAVATAAGLLAGMLPALRSARVDPFSALRDGGRSGGSPARQRLRAGLVTAQIAVALVVLIAAGLFVRALRDARTLDLGFRRDDIVVATASADDQGYDAARAAQFFDRLLEELRALPGVRGAAWSRSMPLGYNNRIDDLYPDGGLPGGGADDHLRVFGNTVSPDYFTVLGIPLRAGRAFTLRDDSAAPRVVIVNEALAAQLWPGQEPLGRVLRRDPADPPATVVGVVATSTWLWLGEAPRPFVYWPQAQRPSGTRTLMLQVDGAPEAAMRAVRAAVLRLDPDMPLYDVRTMEDHITAGRAMLFQRIAAATAGAFGLLGLLLAAVGLFGLVSYGVSQRTQEIGVRVALGADPRRVMSLVLRQALVVVGLGAAIGTALALVVARLVASLLVGARGADPATLLIVTGVLVGVVILACVIPARRALRVAPVIALRAD